MTLDLVVARVATALGRGHALFSPAPVDGSAGLSGSSQTLTSLSNRIAASPQTLGASGQFANAYGEVAQQFSGRLSGTAALDAKLSGLVSDAAAADAAGRNQSGSVVNAAAGDTARTAPFTNTPAGQRALLIALRDRVDEQRQVISAYKTRDAKLAAMVRQLAYRRSAAAGGGGGLPGMMSGLGGMRPPTGGGGSGLGGFSMPNLAGLAKTTGTANTNSALPPPAALDRPGLADEARLQKYTRRINRAITAAFPEIREIGGYRPDALKWHPNGLALDVMIPNYASPQGKALGDRILAFLTANKNILGFDHALWRQVEYDADGTASAMSDRGSPTQNHFDHLHIASKGGGYVGH